MDRRRRESIVLEGCLERESPSAFRSPGGLYLAALQGEFILEGEVGEGDLFIIDNQHQKRRGRYALNEVACHRETVRAATMKRR
jgi:hypothetical protein